MVSRLSPFVVLVSSVAILSCRHTMTPLFDWLPTESAPSGYPVVILRGDLRLADGGSVRVPAGRIMQNGWGVLGSMELVGDRRKPLPVQLSIAWFSFAENKFYSGSFDLPKEAIESLFVAGFSSPSTGKHRTYESVIVGTAPGGVVSVWLGGEGVVRFVRLLHAAESAGDWKQVLDNPEIPRDEYVGRVLSRRLTAVQLQALVSPGIPLGYWDRAAVRYNVTPMIVGGASRSSAWVNYVDGEREYLELASGGDAVARARAAPKQFEIRWTTGAGTQSSAMISLDETESMLAMEKLATANPAAVLALVVDISPASPKVTLRDGTHLLELQKVVTTFAAQ